MHKRRPSGGGIHRCLSFSLSDICIGLEYPSHAQGVVYASNFYGATIPVEFKIALGLELGDLDLTYTYRGQQVTQYIRLKLIHWNMNYWRTVCPGCNRISKKLYLAESEYFQCSKCSRVYAAKISQNRKGATIEELKRNISTVRRPLDCRRVALQFIQMVKTSHHWQKSKIPEVLRRYAARLSRRYGFPIRRITKELVDEVKARYPAGGGTGASLGTRAVGSKLFTASSKR